MRTAKWTVFWMAAALALPLVAVQKDPGAEARLQAAINKETVEGDLKGAIDLYSKLAQSPNRAVAAKALVRMGDCQKTLGQAEARKSYERVIRDFADQKDAVATARTRLDAMPLSGQSARSGVPTNRRVWTERSGSVSWAWPWAWIVTPSPDGRYLTFVDRRTHDLGIRDIATGEERRLTSLPQPPQAEQGRPVFSPDNRRIIYLWRDAKASELRIVDLDSGKAQVLLHTDTKNEVWVPVDWSADGKSILAVSMILKPDVFSTKFALVSVSDGGMRDLRTVAGTTGGAGLIARLSPDGRFVVFGRLVPRFGKMPDSDQEWTKALVERQGGWDFPHLALFIFPVDGGREVLLADNPVGDREPLWTTDGSAILFLSNRTGLPGLWLVHVSNGQPRGRPELVKSDLGDASKLGLTRNGTYFYTVNSDRPSVYMATLDPDTGMVAGPPKEAITRSLLTEFDAEKAWSPDGKFLVYRTQETPLYTGGISPRPTLTIRSISDGHERTLLPSTPLDYLENPCWAPDGKNIFIWGTRSMKKERGVYRVDSASGSSTLLFPSPFVNVRAVGTNGLYILQSENKESRLVFRDFESGVVTNRLVLTEPARLLGAALSPDGLQLGVVISDAAVRTRLLQILPAGGGERMTLYTVTEPEGLGPQSVTWTGDGRALLCIKTSGGQADQQKREVWRFPIDGSQPTYTGLTMDNISGTRAQPKGTAVLFNAGQWTAEFYALENFLPKSVK